MFRYILGFSGVINGENGSLYGLSLRAYGRSPKRRFTSCQSSVVSRFANGVDVCECDVDANGWFLFEASCACWCYV